MSHSEEKGDEIRIMDLPQIWANQLFLKGRRNELMIIPAVTNPEHPTVLFMPGLTGDSQSEYIKSFINIAKKDKNARCVVFIYRGLGGHVLKTPRAYCATDYQDVTRVVDHIKSKYPKSPLTGLNTDSF